VRVTHWPATAGRNYGQRDLFGRQRRALLQSRGRRAHASSRGHGDLRAGAALEAGDGEQRYAAPAGHDADRQVDNCV
jgi:hypothetical protein